MMFGNYKSHLYCMSVFILLVLNGIAKLATGMFLEVEETTEPKENLRQKHDPLHHHATWTECFSTKSILV